MKVPVARNDPIPTPRLRNPAIASRTAAGEVDGHRWLERAGLGLTRLPISGWQVVDLLSGCNRLADGRSVSGTAFRRLRSAGI